MDWNPLCRSWRLSTHGRTSHREHQYCRRHCFNVGSPAPTYGLLRHLLRSSTAWPSTMLFATTLSWESAFTDNAILVKLSRIAKLKCRGHLLSRLGDEIASALVLRGMTSPRVTHTRPTRKSCIPVRSPMVPTLLSS